ncbi:MAG: hypothetical protein HC896_12405 [Bacteroidales bacterium]|nr:hypothetical protein [Bacteroidales bacterium]
MSTTLKLSFLGAILLLCFAQCGKYKCIKGNDNYISISDSLSAFQEVQVEGSFEVFVGHGNAAGINIRADENLLPYISYNVSGKRLYIKTVNDRCLRSANDLQIEISTPTLNFAQLDGSGAMVINNYPTDSLIMVMKGSGELNCFDFVGSYLEVRIEGSGKAFVQNVLSNNVYASIDGSGKIIINEPKRVSSTDNYIVDKAEYYIKGSGEIFADALRVWDSRATIVGSGRILVDPEYVLVCKIEGSGSIFYTNRPDALDVIIDGSGVVGILNK